MCIKMFTEYNKNHRWDGCGWLGINAFLGASAVVGTIPLYFADEYHNGQQSSGFKYFSKLANLKNSSDACTRVFTSLASHMMCNNRAGSKRISEHGFCKALRMLNHLEDTKKDLLFFGNNAFLAYDHNLYIYSLPNEKGKQQTIQLDHGLISKWGFGHNMMNLMEIASIANVDRFDVTTDCENWVIPEEFDYKYVEL